VRKLEAVVAGFRSLIEDDVCAVASVVSPSTNRFFSSRLHGGMILVCMCDVMVAEAGIRARRVEYD